MLIFFPFFSFPPFVPIRRSSHPESDRDRDTHRARMQSPSSEKVTSVSPSLLLTLLATNDLSNVCLFACVLRCAYLRTESNYIVSTFAGAVVSPKSSCEACGFATDDNADDRWFPKSYWEGTPKPNNKYCREFFGTKNKKRNWIWEKASKVCVRSTTTAIV